MATWNNRPYTSDVLGAADRWKQTCLLDDAALFSHEALWTFANVATLRAAFLDNRIHGKERFIDKLEEQLAGYEPAVRQLAAEHLWLLFLFVADSQMGSQTKRDRIAQIWPNIIGELADISLLTDESLSGIAKPGTAFLTKMPDELGYLISVIYSFKQMPSERRADLLSDPWRFGGWIDQQDGSDRRAVRHMLLYLCCPQAYERISSWRHKRKIREALAHRLPSEERRPDDWSLLTTDRILFSIRKLLAQTYETDDLDFYLPPLRDLWPARQANEDTGPDGENIEGRRFWIEKTNVLGRIDRESGDHALGRALWSPQKSKSGTDIYANMRRVGVDDVVLHLTDNTAITGVSLVAALADSSFTGLAGTDWEGAPAYRVPLTRYERLDPPLPRGAFLVQDPFASELRALAKSGAKGLFYNSHRGLNQGAYLTEATPTLLSVLSRAYESHAGKRLPYVDLDAGAELEQVPAVPGRRYTVDDALEDLFLERGEVEDILLLWAAKKNIIIQGPPGVGKSFTAQRLAFALMGAEDRERLGFVQFHQSYSYEDFVEGYRPTSSGFELRTGKFVEFCRRAESDPDRVYVFIIDEINRGNLSKILGELMLLIEGDKREAKWAMELASSKLPFHVPANVNIMGLMNTADRSLAVVDYALRRRFAFVDLKPKLGSPKLRAHLEHAGVQASLLDTLISRIDALNREITADVTNLGPGFAVGHSFFCGGPMDSEDGPSWYARVIRTEIAPLLREYWFDAPIKASSWEDQLLAPL